MSSISPTTSRSGGISPTVLIAIIVAGVLLIVGGVIIGQVTPSILPQQASLEAQQIDNLFHIMLVIGGAIFLLVQGLLVYSVIKFRAKAGETGDGANIHGNTTLEIVWTAIPAVIVSVLTILSLQVFSSLYDARPNDTVIGTAAARFNWNFQYAVPLSLLSYEVDPTTLPQSVQADLADDNLVTIKSPELHTYIGQQVELDMTSADVIHAFWVPAFRLKQDVIPGRTTTIRFTPAEVPGQTYPALYPLKCAELCGAAHGEMYTYVTVHQTDSDYSAWLAVQLEATIFPPADPVERGRNILSSNVYPCYTCHVLGDLTDFNWNGVVGPSLNGVADRAAGARASGTGLSAADYLYQSIHEPGAYLVPGYGNLMPLLPIPECDTWAMIAYLATQSDSGAAPFEVTQPDQCVVTAGPPGAQDVAPAEATAAPAEATPAPTVEATATPSS